MISVGHRSYRQEQVFLSSGASVRQSSDCHGVIRAALVLATFFLARNWRSELAAVGCHGDSNACSTDDQNASAYARPDQ
jgi:hypothetical protein